MFKTNDVVSKCFVRILDVNIGKVVQNLFIVNNILIKFQMLILKKKRRYSLLKKCEKLLQCKNNISVFGYKVVKHLMS